MTHRQAAVVSVWTFTFTVLIIAGLMGDIHFYYHKRMPVKTVIYNLTHPWPPTEPVRHTQAAAILPTLTRRAF
jgi:hypothetical protein